MPAGHSLAGLGLAGHDPVAAPSQAPAPRGLGTGGALRIDPATGGPILLTDGSYQTDHWVDQAVILSLSLTAGTVVSVPTQGNTLSTVRYAGASAPAATTISLRASLAQLVTRGDIALDAVTVERVTGVGSGLVFLVVYRNLRLVGQPPRRVALPVSA
jgi:hypothetical protein